MPPSWCVRVCLIDTWWSLIVNWCCLSAAFLILGKARMSVLSFAMSLWVNLFTFVETKLNRVVSSCVSEKSLVRGGIAVDH